MYIYDTTLSPFLAIEEYAYNATSVDPEGDTILWSLEKAPLGVGIDSLLGTLRWHPTVEQIGNHEIELRAIDSQGAFASQIFTLTVRGTNLPPTILSTPGTTATLDTPYNYQAVGTDPEGDNLTWRVTAGPADLVIDAATGRISWTPQECSSELQQLDRAIEKAAAQLAEFTDDPNFPLTGKLAFGNRWEPERGKALIQEVLVGNSPLKIGLVEGGAKWWQGAYSQERETIYLSAGFVQDKLAYPAGITTVILEEIGHYLDAHLGPGDARGDEGAIFAASVQSRTQERILLEENDWGALTIDGITVTVEYSAPNPVSEKIIVAHDKLVLSNTGFRRAPEDTNQFLKNVTDFFSDGEGGKFLGYAKNLGITGTKLAQAFTQAGHEWTVSKNVPFNVETLLQYDGVFLAGFPANNEVLIDYVNRGGNVYLAAGTNDLGGSAGEVRAWATFLGAFGLAYEPFYNRGLFS